MLPAGVLAWLPSGQEVRAKVPSPLAEKVIQTLASSKTAAKAKVVVTMVSDILGRYLKGPRAWNGWSQIAAITCLALGFGAGLLSRGQTETDERLTYSHCPFNPTKSIRAEHATIGERPPEIWNFMAFEQRGEGGTIELVLEGWVPDATEISDLKVRFISPKALEFDNRIVPVGPDGRFCLKLNGVRGPATVGAIVVGWPDREAEMALVELTTSGTRFPELSTHIPFRPKGEFPFCLR
jgi:hypothetical protein